MGWQMANIAIQRVIGRANEAFLKNNRLVQWFNWWLFWIFLIKKSEDNGGFLVITSNYSNLISCFFRSIKRKKTRLFRFCFTSLWLSSRTYINKAKSSDRSIDRWWWTGQPSKKLFKKNTKTFQPQTHKKNELAKLILASRKYRNATTKSSNKSDDV